MENFAEIPSAVSLSKQVEEQLRNAITEGRMQPNVIYTESNLAQQMGVSRTPVREAVLDLAARGFLTILPRRGFQVRVISEGMIHEVCGLRWALEWLTVRTLAGRPENYDFSSLEAVALAQKETAATSETTGQAFSRRSFLFHMELLQLAANGMVCKIFDDIRDILLVAWTQAFPHTLAPVEVADEHLVLVQLIKAGDPDGAALFLKEHLDRSEQAALAALRANK